MSSTSIAVVWLDRDGTVVDDPGYLSDPDELRLLPGAAEAVARLNAAGLAVVLVTNQSGIARGLMDRGTVDAIHGRLRERLAEAGGRLTAIYYCPHLPPELVGKSEQACDCRKPSPSMVLQARAELGLIGLPEFVVGDKEADLALARVVGAIGVLVLTGEGERSRSQLEVRGETADHVASDLGGAATWILEQLGVGDS